MARWHLTWLSFRYALSQIIVNPAVLFMVIVQPLALAAVAAFILRPVAAAGDGIRVAIGGAMAGMWTSLLFGAAYSFDDERWAGTLELLLGSPPGLKWHVCGKSLADVTLALVSLALSYAVASFVAGSPPVVRDPLAFALTMALSLAGFVAMGMCIAPIAGMFLSLRIWANAFEYPVYILAGFMFPAALLPGWTTPLSWLLPPYWSARALEIAAGVVPGQLSGHLLMLTFTTIGYGALAAVLFSSAANKLRINGQFEP